MQIDPQFQQFYSDPSAFQSPGNAGQYRIRNQYHDALTDPVATGAGVPEFGKYLNPLGGVFASFFGNETGWKPFVDAQGNYVFSNPQNRNPVPVAGVPGA